MQQSMNLEEGIDEFTQQNPPWASPPPAWQSRIGPCIGQDFMGPVLQDVEHGMPTAYPIHSAA